MLQIERLENPRSYLISGIQDITVNFSLFVGRDTNKNIKKNVNLQDDLGQVYNTSVSIIKNSRMVKVQQF